VELSREGFSKLLSCLDSDPDRAGEQYEALRRRLVIFFEGRSCGYESEVLADRTLDVVAEKVRDGSVICSFGSVCAFSYGVAKNLAKGGASPRSVPLGPDPEVRPTGGDPDSELRLQCLERCLDRLPAESRALVLNFYQGERRAKIDNRLRMAETLGITANALRKRTHALRMKLELCVRQCVGQGSWLTNADLNISR
jgi:hypothetical protein